jgi:hypothetical protein
LTHFLISSRCSSVTHPSERLTPFVQMLGTLALVSATVPSGRAAALGPIGPLTVVSSEVAPICFDSASLRTQLAAQLGYDPFSRSLTPRVLVDVQRTGASLGARVTFFDPGNGNVLGSRDLHAASCEELAASLGLSLRLALDVDVVSARPRFSPPPSTRPFTLWLGLGVSGLAGVSPTPALGGTVGIERRWSTSSLGLEAELMAPVTRTSAGGGSFNEQLLVGNVVPCLRGITFGGCAVITVGAARMQGFEYPHARTTATPYVALGARGLAGWPLSARLALLLQAEVFAPVVKPRITSGNDVLWSSPALAGGLGVTLQVGLE